MFPDLLQQVKTTLLNAYENQDLPFDQLVEALAIARDPNRHPIFQIMFAMQEVGNLESSFLGITQVQPEAGLTVAQFDLTVSLQEDQGQIQLQFDYATTRFKEATIHAMASHYESLAMELLKATPKRIGDMRLLTLEEYRQLQQWNHTPAIESPHQNLLTLIKAQFHQHADQCAIFMEDAQMSYRDLNQRSNQLARYLIAKGIKPDAMVAICLNRGMDYIVAMWAVMKIGATYVPLEPDYPENRIQYILQDTNASCVLTHTCHRRPVGIALIICLNEEQDGLQQQSSDDLETMQFKKDAIAYVIYTSGTTGKPKGVPIEHRAIVQRILWCQQTHALTAHERFLHLFSFVFDGSVISTWWPLCFGASLVLPSKNTLTSPLALAHFVQEVKVSTVFGTPSLLKALACELHEANYNQRACVICGGEKLTEELVGLLSPWAYPLYNFYGPTECAVMCTAHQVDVALGLPASVIGKPIANTSAYLLDQYLQPLPVGVVGELYIGGGSLAKEYINQPQLSQDKFIPDPFCNQARLYKTGDFALYLEDGSIDYVGRRDHLIKLRGYRIELEEVAAVIRQHPQVKTAVVCLAEANTLRQRLVAFVVPKQMEGVVQAIEPFIADHLPDYMRPSAVYPLDKIPLTAQGKIDESQLLAGVSTVSASHYQTPRSLTEYKLMEIWKRILKLPHIHINSNFFELGGHSLLLVNLMVDIQREFNLALPLNSLFKYPTIAALADQLEAQVGEDDILLPIQTQGDKTPLILIHPASGLSFAYLSMSHYFPDQPIYALSNPKFYELDAKFNSVEAIAKHYCTLVQDKFPSKAIHLGGWSFGGLVAYEMAKCFHQIQQPVEQLFLFDTYNANRPQFETSTQDERLLHLQELNIAANSRVGTYCLKELVHNEQLARTYAPEQYPGKTVLFTASGSEAASTWQHAMHPKFSVVDVDGTHQQLFNHKNVEGLCLQLKQILEDVNL